jgi:ABC-2 type transport system permease protein
VITEIWREHRALCGRWAARLRREPLSVLALVAQPMVWLLLFGHLFSRMANAAAVPDYLQFMTAGAVAMTTFNACIAGGVELLFDRETGFLVRLLASPAHRLSIVTSRFGYPAALTTVQSLIILAAAYVTGPPGWPGRQGRCWPSTPAASSWRRWRCAPGCAPEQAAGGAICQRRRPVIQ